MKRTLKFLFYLIIITISFSIIYLSTYGIETNKFNQIISKELKKNQPLIDVTFDKIKVKVDLKNLSLYGATFNPKVSYLKNDLPISYVKIYLDLSQFVVSKKPIDTIELSIEEVEIEKLKKIVVAIKPSNFKKIILNNISQGKIKSLINIEFDEELKIENYKVSGKVKNVNLIVTDELKFEDTSFNFISDNDFTLLNSIKSNIQNIPITNGTIQVLKENNYKVEGSITADFELDNEKIYKIPKLKKIRFFENKINLSSKLISKFNIEVSNDLNLENYSLELDGSIPKATLNLKKPLDSNFLTESIESIFFSQSIFKGKLNKNEKNSFSLEGLMKTNSNEPKKYSILSKSNKNTVNHVLNLDFNNEVELKLINYKKDIKKTANLTTEFELKKSKINIKNFAYKDDNNFIKLNNLILDKNRLQKFDNITVKTFKDSSTNNDFKISFKNKIKISGLAYDSSNLGSILSEDSKGQVLTKINKDIEISFKKIFTKLSDPLSDFNLIGTIKKGKFVKISSKTEFLPNKYLDISLKKIESSNKKKLEIYSDVTKPLLANYDFFKDIDGGRLLFTSTFDDNNSTSNLLINEFKVSKAPGFAKLLALADFRGVADLLKGEGLSFDKMEIKFNSNKNILNITELYAVGPSISILMEGYLDKKSKVTSLKGTMVPAKELNKLISKIPILGDILIPKEVGEGLFGVSFKIKGPPKKMKTTVNPIKTLTPRFITKALEKRKKN